ncbi:MAG: cell division ATP-binding protein FtsE [Lachnospiraceae bacterium]|nr:cell division ATP-binding protein FtsE [Lachnospiraceae bacterium]
MARVRDNSNPDQPVINLENVCMQYERTESPALDKVSLRVEPGEFVFVVGDSGSGKSTLIKILLREEKATSGRVFVNGINVSKIRHGKIPRYRRNIGVVFQDFRLLKDRNVYENVAFAQRVISTPAGQIKKNVPSVLSLVGLAQKYKSKPSNLSGGEQQRVAVARALVNKPRLLLCDEPTGNLDPKTTWEIMYLLEEINNSGTTVLVVTHNREIVNAMQKRVVTMKKGVIVSDQRKGGYLDEDY